MIRLRLKPVNPNDRYWMDVTVCSWTTAPNQNRFNHNFDAVATVTIDEIGADPEQYRQLCQYAPGWVVVLNLTQHWRATVIH